MRTNPVKHVLQAGKTVVGAEINALRSLAVPKLFALAGLDFAFIDMEHSAFGLETVSDLIAASRTAGIVPIVRVPEAEYTFITRVLDQGAQGIIVPRVNTPQQVRDIVSWMRYPPQGVRGYASTVAQTDHEPVTASEFIESNHRETLCVIQIERRQAIDNLDEMLAVPGVDVACLGCMDLSVDLGVPGQIDHPTMVAAIERVVAAVNRYGIASGIIAGDFELVATWMRKGIRWVSYSTEALLLQEAATSASRRLREVAESRDRKLG